MDERDETIRNLHRELENQRKRYEERCDQFALIQRDYQKRYDYLISMIADGRALQPPAPILFERQCSKCQALLPDPKIGC